MKSLKAALLTPRPHIKAVEIFGTKVNLRRMTASELMVLEEKVEKLSEAGNGREASLLNVQIVLDCLVDDKGQVINQADLPTASELMDVHDNATIIEAINIVKRHSIGTLEDAEKN